VNRCPSCNSLYEGLAVFCPVCGEPLPAAVLSSPTPSSRGKRPARGRGWALLAALLVGVVLFFLLSYVKLLLHFCLDLDLNFDGGNDAQSGPDPCADANARMTLWFFVAVVPASLAGAAGAYFGVRRLVNRPGR
jgi:hypothetical protein